MRELSRRSAILAGGATVTGIGVLSLSSNNASASISTSGLAIDDATHVLTDSEVTDIRLTVDAEWTINSNAEIEKYTIDLFLGSTQANADLIAYSEQTDQGITDSSGLETLNGSVMSSSSFDLSNFNPSNGEIQTEIVVVLEFKTYRNEEIVAEDTAVETALITVRNEELQVEASISGTGELEFN